MRAARSTRTSSKSAAARLANSASTASHGNDNEVPLPSQCPALRLGTNLQRASPRPRDRQERYLGEDHCVPDGRRRRWRQEGPKDARWLLQPRTTAEALRNRGSQAAALWNLHGRARADRDGTRRRRPSKHDGRARRGDNRGGQDVGVLTLAGCRLGRHSDPQRERSRCRGGGGKALLPATAPLAEEARTPLVPQHAFADKRELVESDEALAPESSI